VLHTPFSCADLSVKVREAARQEQGRGSAALSSVTETAADCGQGLWSALSGIRLKSQKIEALGGLFALPERQEMVNFP
jgi:hypothetical protein